MTVLLVQRPLDAPDLWWHLARGREAFSGSLFPSSQLLLLDEARDANWLGGLPFYLVWSLGGIHALAAIPLVMALAAAWWAARRSSPGDVWWAAVWWWPLGLWAARSGLQPVPALLDLWGLTATWLVLRAGRSDRRRIAAVLLLFVAWANLGPGPVWGILLLLLYGPPGRLGFQLLATALVAGVATPRGLFTWLDSLVLSAPLLFADASELVPDGWHGIFATGPWAAAELAFVLLWGSWVASQLIRGRFGVLEAGRWSVPLFAAMLSRTNVPPASIWILLDWWDGPAEQQAQPKPQQTAEAAAGPSRAMRAGLFAAAMCIAALGLVDASGRGPSAGRLGWGIAHELDVRLLDMGGLTDPIDERIGWCADGRTAGVVAWVDANIRPVDHPERALLGGRWQLHVNLIYDFVGEHRARYRRDDGTWGGFVEQLAEWDVDLLFLPAEDRLLHAAFLGTLYQPADLDSPAVPYVPGDRPEFGPVILEVMRQRAFVETGSWQPSIEIYDGQGWRYDAGQLLGLGVDPGPAVRQSQFFRALEIPMASLRALLPVRRESSHPRLWAEFRFCQQDLAYQEWVTFGEASVFRRRVVGTWIPADEAAPWFSLDRRERDSQTEVWQDCLDAYFDAELEDAVSALSEPSAEQRFAAAMLWLEYGDAERALAELRSIPRAPESATGIAAAYWEERIASDPKP